MNPPGATRRIHAGPRAAATGPAAARTAGPRPGPAGGCPRAADRAGGRSARVASGRGPPAGRAVSPVGPESALTEAPARGRHPLDQLSAAEVAAAAELVRGALAERAAGAAVRFVSISLLEPPKAATKAALAGAAPAPPRRAEAVAMLPTGAAFRVVADLEAGAVEAVAPQPGQPLLTPEDCFEAEAIVKADAGVARLLKDLYGIESMDEVVCDPWSVHIAGSSDERRALVGDETGGEAPRRLVQTFLYKRKTEADNAYAHPIAPLPVVDLLSGTVFRVDGVPEAADVQPVPETEQNYHRESLALNDYGPTGWRADVPKPLEIVQPEGPSFSIDGSVLSWQGWRVHIGFNYREGLVLSDVRFNDRPVMWRGSLVEMAVPYGDPDPFYARKCAFDVGDYGLGYRTDSLELGCDCLGHIQYLDGVLSDSKGEPYEVKKAICIHEIDDGLLWKHVEYRNGHSESRRSRKLVISSICTVVNYEYLFYWHLGQDGSIELEIRLSGELSTNQPSPAEARSGVPEYGTMVAPGVNAQVHQHMFCARLDMDVDGPDCNVFETDVAALPEDPVTNPYGNAFRAVSTPLTSELGAVRESDFYKSRTWSVKSGSAVNPISGKPTAYKLVPHARGAAGPSLLTSPNSMVTKRGGFATKALWVTKNKPEERFPAGESTVQSDGTGGGLPDWVQDDEPLVDEDVVLWHSFGVTHVPRVEDFPVMPCESCGFMLKPDGFFTGNPGIDLPPDVSKGSKEECCSR